MLEAALDGLAPMWLNGSMNNAASLEKITQYIENNPIATLGTISADGTPYGAAIYACTGHSQTLYFVTKTETRKYKNLIDRPAVSITVMNQREDSTLQAVGQASVVRDAPTLDMVLKKITRAHALAEDWLPPISKLRAGSYNIVGVKLTYARLAEFKNQAIGSEHIFTQFGELTD